MYLINHFLRKGNQFLLSKLYVNAISKLPRFLSGLLLIWFNHEQYKKIRILIFIILTILLDLDLFILKTKTKCFFYINLKLISIVNLVNFYLSNVDIVINKLHLTKGFSILEIIILYNNFPILPELDIVFEEAISLLTIIEEKLLGLKIYLHTDTIIGAETFLRTIKLPLFLTK